MVTKLLRNEDVQLLQQAGLSLEDAEHLMACYKCSRTEYPAPPPEPEHPPLPERLRRAPWERARSRSPRGREEAPAGGAAPPSRPRIVAEEFGRNLVDVSKLRLSRQ
ncbi:hypothetical protein TKK_0019677 [Trichogramma kaykai]|uniref:Uncharacterized protein n=1 Tax=Trichogramma kaykai TaxID=54128 RepID=A0ABD2VRY5_9HYME